MSMPPSPHSGQYPQRQWPPQPNPPYAGPPPPPQRRKNGLPWIIGGAVVLVVAVAVTLVLMLNGDESVAGADLSTPESAAKAFADAVKRGDRDAVVKLSCVSHDACVSKHGQGADSAKVEKAREKLKNDLGEFAGLGDAQFSGAPKPMQPGVMAVEYRTPAMKDGESRGLLLAEVDGKWFALGVAGSGRR